MTCKYCGEIDESKLVMRTDVKDSEIENYDICLECWEKMILKSDLKTN